MRAVSLALPILFALPILMATAPLQAETLSAEIGRTGLAATETRLAALASPTDEDRFTLGGVAFLRALEISMQDRWAEGLTDRTGMLPFLRLPLEDNPNPKAFDPAAIAGIFQKTSAQLDIAKAALTAIPAGSDFGAKIALNDLWLDVNANGQREPEEDFLALLNSTLDIPQDSAAGTPPAPISFRFDAADASWLAAYSDMLNAICNMVLAYDPTQSITQVLDARSKMRTLGPVTDDMFFGGQHDIDSFDLIAMIAGALNQQPDKPRMLAAQAHFLDMIAENRSFWSRVAVEKDDAQEWLPNAKQHSALGIDVPADAGEKWLAVLDQLQAVVKGDKLMPFWRVGAPAGLNLGKLFADPRPIDVFGWLQGWAALPYLENGPLVGSEAMDAFEQSVNGESMLFMLYFN